MNNSAQKHFKPIDYQTVLNNLVRDYGFKSSGNGYLINGTCPDCSKRELFTDSNKPFTLKCNRLNKCGYEETIKDIYPEVFEDLTKKHPATKEDPRVTAKVYLSQVRGFDLARINGWYDQDVKFDAPTGTGSATVRFYLDKAKTRFWERIIDYADVFGKKAHFGGKRREDGKLYRGEWWQPPGMAIDPERPLYLVEGIFDTIALLHAGFQVVSLMSSNNYPELSLKTVSKNQTLVFALDNNTAGINASKKYARRAIDQGFNVFMAIPETLKDWNDLFITRGAEGLRTVMDNALWHGATLLAYTAAESAAIWVARTQKSYRLFEKNNAYWDANYSRTELEKAVGDKDDPQLLNGFFDRDVFDLLKDDVFLGQIKAAINTNKLSNCVAEFEYQQVNQYDESDRRYHFRVCHENGAIPEAIELSGSSISEASALNKALLSATAGGDFTGGKKHIEYLRHNAWLKTQPKIVKTVDFIGYDAKSGAYVFDKVAFFKNKRIEINKQGYFDARKLAIKTTLSGVELDIGTDFNPQEFTGHFVNSFGERGLITLAWWTASLFAEQLRGHFGYFPFFEICGQASSGKSTLIEVLWKLFGRSDYEGFNPLQSSPTALDRNLSKVANIPAVIIESDANDEINNARGFNWEMLKPAYNGNAIRDRGMKTQGNETKANPFRATLMSAQNVPIDGSEAILSRFVHLTLHRTHHKPGGKFHADTLRRMDVDKLSGFMPLMILNADSIISDIKEKHAEYAKTFKDAPIYIERIIDNHAIVMAMLATLTKYLPIEPELVEVAMELCRDLAVKRQESIQKDHPSVQEFWDKYEYLNVSESKGHGAMYSIEILNHSVKEGQIAINFAHFESVCRDRGVSLPDLKEVKRHIQSTKAHKYQDQKAVNSNILNKTVRCYLFEDSNFKK